MKIAAAFRHLPHSHRCGRSVLGVWLTGWAITAAALPNDIAGLSLEQLMNEPVTSVSKKATKLGDAAAAIYIVTQEDIRRLGVTSLPEALRQVPGLDVAQISPSAWAVTARGFNDQFSRQLLVLIDGRTVYTPASAAVFWNAQDVMIEDVERIEVIRGPGATLWGANAVNGVINIITKAATDTQGGLISALTGSDSETQVAARYGMVVAPDAYLRLYAKYTSDGGLPDTSGTVDVGQLSTLRGGFRLDLGITAADTLTLQGDVYTGSAGTATTQISLLPASVLSTASVDVDNGANVLGRWSHTYSSTSSLALQAYVDRVDQGDGAGAEHRYTGDFDLQHFFQWGPNSLVWGSGFRRSSITETPYSFTISWEPQQKNIELFNAFLQDEATLIPERLRFTIGAKLEHNSLDGWQLEPNIRLAASPADGQTLWAAVSRAARTPSLFELDGRGNLAAEPNADGGLPTLISLLPNPSLEPEKLTAFEIGYRIAPSQSLSFDVASFVNHYTNLIYVNPVAPMLEFDYGPPHRLISYVEDNSQNARSYGVETSAHWQATQNWRLDGGYSFLRLVVPNDPAVEHRSPRQQAQVRSYLDLPDHLELNTALYYVDAVSGFSGPLDARIPCYVRLDTGLVWNAGALSLGVWGRNLLQHDHLEFMSTSALVLVNTPRSVIGKITWRF